MPKESGGPVTPEMFERAMKKKGDSLFRFMRNAFSSVGKRTADVMTVGVTRGPGPNEWGGVTNLRTRTGDLARSFAHRVTPAAGTKGKVSKLRMVVYTNSPYARIHEFGGTVRPTKSKWLTIPLKDAKTPGGVPNMSARDVPTGKGQPGFFARSKETGNLYLAERMGKGKNNVKWYFVLKKKVDIPAGLGFRQTWISSAGRKYRENAFQQAIVKSLQAK